MSRDIVPTCREIRHGWAGRIPVAGYGPTRYAWSALQRVPVLRHGVQVAGPRTVVRRQDRRAAGRLALATSRLAGGRVPAVLWWSELHTGSQSVHVLPPPPRRPWRVRTVTRADSVPLSCAVMSLIRPPASSLCPGFEPGPVAGPCLCEHLLEVRGEGHPTWRYRLIGPPLKHGRSSSAGVAPQAARRGGRGRGPTAGAGASVRGGGAAARTGEAVSPPRLGVATTSPCSWRWRGARARPRRGPPDRASLRRSACRRPGARPGVAAPSLAATPSSPSRA